MMGVEGNDIRRYSDTILIAGLLLFLFGPLALAILQTDQLVSLSENRSLSVLPSLPESHLETETYPARFNEYYNDHFGLREELSSFYKELKYALGDTPSQEVIVGKDGWLFLGKRKAKIYLDPMGFARNDRQFTLYQLKVLARFYSELAEKLRKQGSAYLLVITPSKSSIYFEQLPDYFQKVRPDSATDQFVSYLRQHTDIDILDLREALLREKQKRQVFFKADTHWNQYGANVAQFEIMQVLAKWFPGKITAELFPLEEDVKIGGDLGNMTGVQVLRDTRDILPSPIFAGACEPEIRKVREAGKPRVQHTRCAGGELALVVSRDSFFTALEPYFARTFREAVFVWDKSNSPTVDKYLQKHPDVFIEIWAERNLDYRMRKDPMQDVAGEQGY